MADKKLLSVEESLAAFERTLGEARRALDVAAVLPMRGSTMERYVAYQAIEDAARNLKNALAAANTHLQNLRWDIRAGLE